MAKMGRIVSEKTVTVGDDFLQDLDDEIIRSNARNIIDSYAHPWDILAESLQNAVDAIEMRAEGEPNCEKFIHITFDESRRSIEVVDSGVGISPDDVTSILTPGKSLKRAGVGPGIRGEKGVGLSFMVLSTDRFVLETCDGNKTSRITINDAHKWTSGISPKRPKIDEAIVSEVSSYNGSQRFSRFSLEHVARKEDDELDIFLLSKVRLIHLLRTRTAVGNTYPIFNGGARPPVDIRVSLKFISPLGAISASEDLDYQYATPASYLKKSRVFSWEKFEDLRNRNNLRPLQGNSLERVGKTQSKSGREVKWYMFESSRRTYDNIAESAGLVGDDGPEIGAGIFVSTKSMPTGVSLPPPQRSQQASYWPMVFILLEYDAIRWDMGRKAVTGRTTEMLRGIAKDIFDDAIYALPHLIGGKSADLIGLEKEQELNKVKAAATGGQALDFDKVKFLKVPKEEQGVIALFHELIGTGLIKSIATYQLGVREQYDAVVRVALPDKGSSNVVLEYKHKGEYFLEDLDGDKRAADVRILVCWEIDEMKCSKQSVEVEALDNDGAEALPEATHRLYFGDSALVGSDHSLLVIALKDFIRRYR